MSKSYPAHPNHAKILHMARDDLRQALKASVSALDAAGVPVALGGSYALWVHGAPEPDNDVDLVVAEQDADAAAEVLGDAGFTIERPPENWLFKAVQGEATVDALHRMNGVPVDRELITQAAAADVFGLGVRTLDAQTVVTVKLRSLNEHYCDLAPLLPVVRAVREQLDIGQLRKDVSGNPYAESFVFLAERLRIFES